MHSSKLSTGVEGTGGSQGLDDLVELVSSSLSIDPISKYGMENCDISINFWHPYVWIACAHMNTCMHIYHTHGNTQLKGLSIFLKPAVFSSLGPTHSHLRVTHSRAYPMQSWELVRDGDISHHCRGFESGKLEASAIRVLIRSPVDAGGHSILRITDRKHFSAPELRKNFLWVTKKWLF